MAATAASAVVFLFVLSFLCFVGGAALRRWPDKVQGYIEVGRQEGAELVYGGKRPDTEQLKDGYFIEPTIFTRVDNDMRVAREFNLSHQRIFGLTFEVFNLLNDDTLRILEIRDSQLVAVRRFGRRMQIGVRFAF